MHSSLFYTTALLAAGATAGPLKQVKGRDNGGFCNTVFNTDACRHPGWKNVWGTLSSHGVSNFIAFTLDALHTNAHYNLNDGSPCPEPDGLEAARIPMVTDPTELAAAKDKVAAHAFGYLELYNEPDYSYENLTPLTSSEQAGKDLKPLIDMEGRTTQLLSPAVAYTGSDWLKDFGGNCTGCMDKSKIPIIGAHIYSVEPQGAIDLIETVHRQWPDQKIWITEIAPSTGDPKCLYDTEGMKGWMTTVINKIRALGYVEKIFWNTGTWGILNNNPDVCNPSLTNDDGTATELLKHYQTLCT